MNTRALVIDDFGDVPHLGEVPVPALEPTQVLIRVRAASINAFDWKAADGVFRGMFRYHFPVTVGRDYSGVVEATGADASRVAVGDEVFGYFTGQDLQRGSYAEHVWVDEGECFVVKPASLAHADAACLPLCGVVAIRCVEGVNAGRGDVVLVVGAPGGVGSYAVQLAAARGARVIATGPPEDAAYLTDLGAAEVLEPGDSLIAEVRRRHPDGIAGMIDLVHYRDAFIEHLDVLAAGGHAVSTHRAVDDELLAERGLSGANITSMPGAALLEQLGEAAATGALRVPIQRTYGLEQAVEGLAALKHEHARGKLVIAMD